ncbi:hypothetical protein CRG98_044246 [Punica granatum]|uniref:G-patch domain-containing protein n=1 Tax=Punica granatum TaxID=22663 RepID=A0A2I0HUI2_PUNGR|nr:hypothetical protein CRG98_044246 [Punica granatum]
MSLKAADIPTWADLSSKFIDQYRYCVEAPPTLLELSTMEMTNDQGFEAYVVKWRARAAKHVPPISEAHQIQLFHSTLKGAYYLHLLAYTSSFSNLIDARKKLDIGVKLGKIEGPTEKKEGESSKNAATGPRLRELLSRCNGLRPRRTNRASRHKRGVNSSHPCRLRSPTYTSNSSQDQSRRCEYHQGAPGHTTDNCWKLRERIQQMIDDEQLTFNAVKPPNVQSNPLPDHGSSSGHSINMIGICAIGEYETGQEAPAPFVIEYVPAETGVGYAGFDATPAPFVIEVPAREPYQDSKVPWTYEGSVGNLERQFGVMGVTRSDRVYENPEAANKGKAPAAALGIALEATLIPQKKVPKETAPDLIAETVGSIFSNNISFSDDELPSEGLLLGRPWIHSAGAVPSTLHQKLKFIVEERLITVKGEEDYAIYKEMAVPYISIGDDQNLPFHSFDTISVIRDYGKVGSSRADRMVGKILLRHNYIPGSGLGAHGQGINRPIEIEEYKNMKGLGFCPSCHEIIEARRGKHLHRLAAHYGKINKGIPIPPLSHFFPALPNIVRGTLDDPFSGSEAEPVNLSAICAITEEIPFGVYVRLAQENEELNNWTSIPRYSALHLNPKLRHGDSNPSEECLEKPRPIYFGEGLDEDGRVPEIEESLRRLEDRQLTSVEPTKEINVGSEEEPHTLKIGTGLDPEQRAQMIDFLKEYQEVFA